MHKIKFGLGRDMAEYRVGVLEENAVPTHLRNFKPSAFVFQIIGESFGDSRHEPDTPRVVFLGRLQDDLRSQTNAHKRLTVVKTFFQPQINFFGFQVRHGFPCRADSWKNDMGGGIEHFCIVCDHIFFSNGPKRPGDTRDISGIIINNCNHITFVMATFG